jgi:hypothetical protein
MASIVNTVKHGNSPFTGVWEDIQKYTTVKITIKSPVVGEAQLKWANPPRGRIPGDQDIIDTTDICYSVPNQALTFERDAQARWFKLLYDTSDTAALYTTASLEIDVLYKNAPTSIKFTDSSENRVVKVDNTTLYTVIVDNSGNVLGSTNSATGEALFMALSDASGEALVTASGESIPPSLGVALRDDNAFNLSSLGTALKSSVNALYVHTADVCGHDQAGGREVAGANKEGISLFLTAAPDSTNTTKHSEYTGTPNALYVHLTDYSANQHNVGNPVPLQIYRIDSVILPFDLSTGVVETMYAPSALKGGAYPAKVIKNLYLYNDGPVTVWVRLFDVSTAHGTEVVYGFPDYIRQTIPVGAGCTQEITYPRGIRFNNGVAIRATTEPFVDSSAGPGANTVFIQGTYTDSIVIGTSSLGPYE